MPIDKAFNPEEFRATLNRMAEGTDYGQTPMAARFDPIQHAEVRDHALHGRRIEEFRKALEGQGFVYFPAHHLAAWENGLPKMIGEWRCNLLKLALTDDDVLAWFETPKALWDWAEEKRNALRVKLQRAKKIQSAVPR